MRQQGRRLGEERPSCLDDGRMARRWHSLPRLPSGYGSWRHAHPTTQLGLTDEADEPVQVWGRVCQRVRLLCRFFFLRELLISYITIETTKASTFQRHGFPGWDSMGHEADSGISPRRWASTSHPMEL